ncbi:MAG: hypothetical protein KC496_21455 [Anaerolineae bacterium]|nr:hypothetical protein [Anaerolineae bacterium]
MFGRWTAMSVLVVVVMLPLSIFAQEWPEPVPIPTAAVQQVQVDYEGVQFRFDVSLATAVSAANYPATAEGDGPVASPGYTEFTFDGYQAGEYLNYAPQPRVDVFTIGEFGAYGFYIQQLDQLNQILSTRPDLNQYVNASPGDPNVPNLPFLPVFNAAQVFRTHPEYIELPQIRGIRYLVYFSQAANPITSGEIFYTFQGITDDGQHYVSAILPVDTGTITLPFPDMAQDNFGEQYRQYLSDVLGTITATPEANFSPSLHTLDALAASIMVNR